MKTFRLRFTLDADLIATIEAKDLEDAKNYIKTLDFNDLIEGSCINDYVTKDIDCESIEEEHVKVKASITDIEWDIDDDDYSPIGLPIEDNIEIEVDNYNGEVDDYDIEEAISDYLSDTYRYTVNTFKYKIISKE